MDYTVHGILQARTLEWIAFPFSRGSSQPRDWTQVSRTAGGFFTSWATREVQEYWSGYPIPSLADLPNPGVELGSPALQVDSLPNELWREPSILTKGIFNKKKKKKVRPKFSAIALVCSTLNYKPKSGLSLRLSYCVATVNTRNFCHLVALPVVATWQLWVMSN